MTEEIIIDGELSCNNCLEKTRCKQQQEVKVKRIDAILSYIANEDNEKYIAELKNEIPAITRCDVVLEKQLKRLEQENKEQEKQIEAQKGLITVGGKQQYKCLQEIDRLQQENEVLKASASVLQEYITKNEQLKTNIDSLVKINERLKQENKELKEWKDKVVKLFESACRCKYLNEEKDICSYTNEKCININKCVYKYQELSDNYRSALEEIRNTLNKIFNVCDDDYGNASEIIKVVDKIIDVLND